jgi:hypothetical protein
MFITFYTGSDDFFSDHSLLILGLNSKPTKSKMDVYILRYINYNVKKLILKEIKLIYFDLDKKRLYHSQLFIYRLQCQSPEELVKLKDMFLKGLAVAISFAFYFTYKSNSNYGFSEPVHQSSAAVMVSKETPCSNTTSNSINKDVEKDDEKLYNGVVERKKHQFRTVEGHMSCKSQLHYQTKTHDERNARSNITGQASVKVDLRKNLSFSSSLVETVDYGINRMGHQDVSTFVQTGTHVEHSFKYKIPLFKHFFNPQGEVLVLKVGVSGMVSDFKILSGSTGLQPNDLHSQTTNQGLFCTISNEKQAGLISIHYNPFDHQNKFNISYQWAPAFQIVSNYAEKEAVDPVQNELNPVEQKDAEKEAVDSVQNELNPVEQKASSESLKPSRFGRNTIERFNGLQDRVVLTNPALNDFFAKISHYISIPFDIQLNLSKIYQLDMDLNLSPNQLKVLSALDPNNLYDRARRCSQELKNLGLHSCQIYKLAQLNPEELDMLTRMSVEQRQTIYKDLLVNEIMVNLVHNDDQPIGFFCRNDSLFVSCEASHLSSETKIALIRYIDKLKLGHYEYKKLWEILIEKPLFEAFVLKLF